MSKEQFTETTQCPFCLRWSVDTTFEKLTDANGSHVKTSVVARDFCTTRGCRAAKPS